MLGRLVVGERGPGLILSPGSLVIQHSASRAAQPRKKACVVKADSSYADERQKDGDSHKVLKPLVFAVPHIASLTLRERGRMYSAVGEHASRADAEPRTPPLNRTFL